MMRDKIAGGKLQRHFIECNRIYAAALSMRQRRTFIREAAQNPQPWILRAG